MKQKKHVVKQNGFQTKIWKTSSSYSLAKCESPGLMTIVYAGNKLKCELGDFPHHIQIIN